jgi:outer membrane protein OmpA-like peptidoglycan-associated protein
MKQVIIASGVFAMLSVSHALCQEPTSNTGSVPIYRVTVVERTTKAINYQYRTGPTRIDFRGTVLLPKSKGDAVVESKQGRTEIDAHFEGLMAPSRYGAEYLTYVLWALTPDGRPHNIGEVVANGSDKAHLHVTTDLQAFALIVTAEPYSAVRQPGDVVVLENEVRPDTIGKIEEVNARYELLPRGHYSWQIPPKPNSLEEGPKVSMRKYEELLEIYQAQNAIGIARVANAAQYAPNTFAKAEQLLTEAQQLERSRGENSMIIQAAREAAQTAEDARIISERRAHEEKLAQARSEASTAQRAQAQAEADAQLARSQADAAQARIAEERAAREHAEIEAAAAHQKAAQAQADLDAARQAQTTHIAVTVRPDAAGQNDAARKSTLRMQLMEQLNGAIATRDTPRGLVATISFAEFNGTSLSGTALDKVARIGRIVAAYPGLRVEVEGHTDGPNSESLSLARAEAARQMLLARGLPAGAVSARGFGNSRPIASNATVAGREENQRIEIVISGDPIGSLPFWDRTYSLKRQ